MSKTMEFEVTVLIGEDLGDSTRITVEVTDEEQQSMLKSECKFPALNDDPSLADLTGRVQAAVSHSGWLPFDGEDLSEYFTLCFPDDYTVNYPDEICQANQNALSASRKQYKLKGLRWGYDGGGVCCGPIDGSALIEAMVMDGSGRLLFFTMSRFTEFAKITMSRAPLFDILMQLPDMDLNFPQENEIIENMTLDSWEFEYADLPADMLHSPLTGIFKLLLQAETHCPTSDRCEDFEGAQEFLAAYYDKTGQELMELDLPDWDRFF